MFASIKKMMEMNRKTGHIREIRDEQGLLAVDVTVRCDDNFISPYSYGSEPVLSQEVAEFLQEGVRPIHIKEDLHIRLHSDVIDESEQEEYAAAIRNYYRRQYVKERQHIKRDLTASVFMLLTGLLFFGVMILLDFLSVKGVFTEIVDIVAWVFIWEATDLFFLQRRISTWQARRAIAFYEAKISFLKLDGSVTAKVESGAENAVTAQAEKA